MITGAVQTVSVRVVVGLFGGMLAAVLAFPVAAHAQTETETDLEMGEEAWFFRYRQPAADAPDRTPVDDPTGSGLDTAPGIAKATIRDATGNIYPGQFSRVGVVNGEQEALAYLSFPLIELGDGQPVVVKGGTVTLVAAPQSPEEAPEDDPDADPDQQPANNAAASQQRNIDGADMVACAVKESFFTDVGGNWADRPEIDTALCSPLESVEVNEGERATWTVDLAPFAELWAEPLDNHGIAIVPNPDTEASPPEQNWHVAFPMRINNATDPAPTVELQYEIQSFDDPGDVEEDFEDDFQDDFQDDFESAPQDGGFDDAPQDGGFDGGFDVAADDGFDDGGSDDFDSADTGFDDAFEEPATEPQAAEDEPVETEEEPQQARVQPIGDQETGIRTNPAVFLLPPLGLGLASALGYSLTREPELVAERKGAVSRLMERQRSGG